jgi:phosphatidylethanolamine/phosphatidyl-N-methylethanolamine N-methyltransferase
MPLQSSVRVSKKPRLDDEVRFLRSWIEKPLHMGAVMPSSKLLARTMAEYVDVDSDGPVVELGPGTGAITNALIEHGVDQKRLVLVEYNPGFCALLRDRYPQAKVVQGDAYTLRADPQIAARRVHGSLRADLDEPSARAGLGVSQGLSPTRRAGLS